MISAAERKLNTNSTHLHIHTYTQESKRTMQSTRTTLNDDDVKEMEQKLDEVSISDSSRSSSNEEELCKVKNENYHLKLAIGEKNDEILRLHHMLHKEAYLENLHKVLPSLQNGPLLYPASSSSQGEQQDGEPSIIDSEVATHISASPYKGNRARSTRTESSLATTTISRSKKRSKILEEHLIPFLQRSIQTFHASSIFQKESVELRELWQFFEENNGEDETLLVNVLENLTYLQQQSTTLLNRELHFKKLSQRLEYLFTVFLNPKEYDMAPQEHIEKLKNDLLNILIKLFDRIPANQENNRELSRKEIRAQKIADLEKGIDLCTEAMNNAYGSSKTAAESEKHSDNEEHMPDLSHFSNQEKQRLKKNRTSLEFIPIGYDENMLNTRTPQRPLKHKKQDLDVTPVAQFRKDENDPLQKFFQEQDGYSVRSLSARR
ncbi:ZYRO0E02618p [Zygosaccharomyces rouxii]|uniref:ZYRO0E02618p n=1 Tax=Zygosaccharomyces rouxii (strain ATCC 2623 / CBS 732 / NBRC 1130 / NCYC 568 / NRRL Y-229) TaxID=559307 RepID=C5E443_ZYGRC|nr:uncharacterized protein ZYRO0E02618g [Zygosaccharomyces rouxii]KAH9198336.1 hypothetical protein LQ764DRAFT_211709 [Zygosaccharomyces rouxii]CAR30804.1 ZYRO0E02618p [Zygosaccharomyces rouxii]